MGVVSIIWDEKKKKQREPLISEFLNSPMIYCCAKLDINFEGGCVV